MQGTSNIVAAKLQRGDRITWPQPAGVPAVSACAGREVTSVPTLTAGRVHFTTVDGGGNRRVEELAGDTGVMVTR
jgi:hypothetical protein